MVNTEQSESNGDLNTSSLSNFCLNKISIFFQTLDFFVVGSILRKIYKNDSRFHFRDAPVSNFEKNGQNSQKAGIYRID